MKNIFLLACILIVPFSFCLMNEKENDGTAFNAFIKRPQTAYDGSQSGYLEVLFSDDDDKDSLIKNSFNNLLDECYEVNYALWASLSLEAPEKAAHKKNRLELLTTFAAVHEKLAELKSNHAALLGAWNDDLRGLAANGLHYFRNHFHDSATHSVELEIALYKMARSTLFKAESMNLLFKLIKMTYNSLSDPDSTDFKNFSHKVTSLKNNLAIFKQKFPDYHLGVDVREVQTIEAFCTSKLEMIKQLKPSQILPYDQ